MNRRAALVLAPVVVAFLVACVFVARWLNTDSVERGAITDLLRAQAQGDAGAVLRALDCTEAGCRAAARENARRLRTPGELQIVRLDSATDHALGGREGYTRVVWQAPDRLPTVQCVLVRRTGNPVSGTSVSLLRLTPPIAREASCP